MVSSDEQEHEVDMSTQDLIVVTIAALGQRAAISLDKSCLDEAKMCIDSITAVEQAVGTQLEPKYQKEVESMIGMLKLHYARIASGGGGSDEKDT